MIFFPGICNMFNWSITGRYILLQSDSEQRLIGTKWKQQDGGCEEVIKASAPAGPSAALWTDKYEP